MFGATPIIAGKDLRYIIMLGGGLVFIYDLIPLIAAFKLSEKLPSVFANARMNLSARMLKSICVVGILILLAQGVLSFSDIDRTGWILVALYIALVIIYIQVRGKNRLPEKLETEVEPPRL